MKILLPFFLFIFIFQVGIAQDRGWAIGFSIDGTFNKSEYTYTEFFEEDPAVYAKGYGLQFIAVERTWNQRWAFQTGLHLSRIKFQPKMYLPWSYGTQFDFEGRSATLFNPTLDENSFGLLSIPIGIKFLINPKKKWQLFTGLTLVNTLLLNEVETYKGEGAFHDSNSGFQNSEALALTYSASKIQFFNMALDWNIGLQYPLSPFWKVFLQPGIRLLEFRTANEKFKRNGEFLYDNQWLKLSQVKLSLGALRFF